MKSKSGDNFVPALRGGMDAADLLNAIRGNDMFADFYEQPDTVHKALEFCVKAEKWFIESQMEMAGDCYGGYMSGMGVWLPGHSFGHFAEDWSVLCSPQMYEEFGRPYIESLISGLDHALMHTHSAGIQAFPSILDVKKLTYIQITSDPNAMRAIEVYKKFAKELEGKTVILGLSEAEIYDNADFLKGRKTIIEYYAKTVDEAKRIIDFVKEKVSI